jgi:curli biogenesis system outer membrane secretion channel CsgG
MTKTHSLARFAKAGLAGLLLAGLAACATTPTPDVKPRSQPTAPAVANKTNFSEALVCMDDLYYAYGVRDVRITTKGITDATGEVSVGTRDMLISAVSRMSVKSRAFTFVDYEVVGTGFGGSSDPGLSRVQRFGVTPNYYIRGAISQLDEGVVAKSMGGGIQLEKVGVGFNTDQSTSVVSVDMNVGEVENGTILPGVYSANSISVRRRSKGGDADARIEKNGAFFQFSYTQSEGVPQSVRTLIELNTIEVLGKLARVPYWRCLGLPQTNPAVQMETRKYFSSLTRPELVTFVQRSLAGAKVWQGPVDGAETPALLEAIGRYQAENGLIATRRIDYDLYAALLGADIELAKTATAGPAVAIKPADVKAALYISLSDMIELPAYTVGQPLIASARLNDGGFLYCFYQDGKGQIARIFPNRFQPNPYVPSGTPVRMPDPNAGFTIVFQTSRANEKVACYAAKTELKAAPITAPDLEPLPLRSMADLTALMRAAKPGDVADAEIEFLVR